MKKPKYKTNKTKKRSNRDSQPSASEATSSSEFHAIYSSRSTVQLFSIQLHH